MKKIYIYEVAPLATLPFKKPLFSYYHTKKLVPGTVVTIPFSGQTLIGVIMEVAQERDLEDLKEILTIEERPPLTMEQRVFCLEVSRQTYTPLGRVLKHAVPKKTKARKKAKVVTERKVSKLTENTTVKKILADAKGKPFFLTISSHKKNSFLLLALVQELLRKHQGQILFLVPDIATAIALEVTWKPTLKDSLAALHHQKTPAEYFSAWETVSDNSAKVILATRGGLFAPFKALNTVIQLDPNDDAYKQWDMSPRYHATFLLPCLQNLYGCKVIQIGPQPTLASFLSETDQVTIIESVVKPQWINLKLERYKKNWHPLSLDVEQAIQKALHHKEQCLIFVHQSGLGSFSVCKECRTIFRCPSCKSALKLTQKETYRCRACGFQSNLFPSCPLCQSIEFKSIGYGTQKIANEIQKKFPKARVQIGDKDHLKTQKELEKFYSQTGNSEPDIFVTTGTYLRFPPLSRLSLIAIIDADSLLHFQGYKRDEQLLELINKMGSLLPSCGQFFIQSFVPESDLFRKIESQTTLSSLQQILEERQALRYPPITRSLIIEPNPKIKGAEKDFAQTLPALKKIVAGDPALKKNVMVQGASRKVRGQNQKYLLVRYLPPMPEALDRFLCDNAGRLFIDHDPLSIT